MASEIQRSDVLFLPEYAKYLVSNFREKLTNYCDVNLCANGQKFSAHKVVLAASCDYFFKMFSPNFKESREDEVNLDVDPKSLEIIVNYIYTGNIEINDENVQNVLRTSHFLQIKKPIQLCYEYLKNRISSKNCIGIMKLGEHYSSQDLKQEAENYFNQHFLKVCKNEEFFDLSFEKLSFLLKSDHVAVHSEEQIFSSVKNWIEYDKNNRIDYLYEFLKVIRLHLLLPQFTANEVKPYCVNCPKAINILMETYEAQLIPEKKDLLPPRRDYPPTYYEKLHVFGCSQNKKLIIDTYNPQKNTWSTFFPLNLSISACGLGRFDDDKVIVVGGLQGSESLDTVYCVDLEMKTIFPLSPLPFKCHSPEVVILNNEKTKVCVIGGQTGNHATNSLFIWDPATQIWELAASMVECRQLFGAAAINHKIYVAGGWNNSQTLNTVEMYDSLKDEWTQCSSMNVHRRSCSMGAVGGYLYVIGGRDTDGRLLSSVEQYDPLSNRWSLVKNLPKTCEGLKVVEFSNKTLLVVGGGDFTCEVFQYFPESNTWSVLSKNPNSFQSIGAIAANSE